MGRCEPCGKGEAMAGGKEELAAMLHGSGFGLEGFGGGERFQDWGHTDEGRAALFHSVF